jgi:hypothetical protein
MFAKSRAGSAGGGVQMTSIDHPAAAKCVRVEDRGMTFVFSGDRPTTTFNGSGVVISRKRGPDPPLR